MLWRGVLSVSVWGLCVTAFWWEVLCEGCGG